MDINLKGTILRIERTSIHDGTGLRTVVFMKGCPLRCIWCSTPESHNIKIEKGYLSNKCSGCGICINSCPEEALSFSLNNRIVIDKDRCKMNLLCYERCPNNAYKKYGKIMTVSELINEISKDEIFYFHSEGGVTFSGGEPLLQSEFLSKVMEQCKRLGIHVAMETCLFAPFKNISKILPYLDDLYVDIKHMDSNKHKKYTGVDNSMILENILKIDDTDYPIDIYIRIPLIPTINDSKENLLSTINFCRNIKKLKEIEILPYHRLGIETYKNLGLEYKLSDIKVPTTTVIQEIGDFMTANSQGIRIRIGGSLVE